jgi:iron(III) transport system substrate-binding protein
MMALAAFCAACDRDSEATNQGSPPREVVVYCSADAPVARPVFEAFEKKTGIKVKPVFDTEATKTTGLVNRLIAEHEQGKTGPDACDVWWSSEPFGTIRLSRAGVLEKYESVSGPASWKGARGVPADGSWPGARAGDGTWYGFVRRLRVIVYNTKFAGAGPMSRIGGWMDLAQPQWKGRVGMARPQFGTTRGHMAAMHAVDDGKMLRTWLEAMAANDVRLYDGNASVVKAVASGEVYAGLTDSDDAINGMRQGWPLGIILVGEDGGHPVVLMNHMVPHYAVGAMAVPNTTAVVAGGAHREEARTLVDFLLSKETAELLSAGEACALMFGDTLMPELHGLSRDDERVKSGTAGLVALEDGHVNYERLADHIEPAMKICDEVLKGR